MERPPDAPDPPAAADEPRGKATWSEAGTTLAARWLLLGTVFVPLVLYRGVYFPFITTRALLFRLLVGAAWLIFVWQVLVRELELVDARDPVLWGLAAWGGAALLSALLSPATHHSLYGSMERMWGVTQWGYLLVFYGLVRVYFDRAWWSRFLRASLLVSVAVGLYAAGQYAVSHGIGPLWEAPVVGSAPSRFASTLGNNGYLSAYALLHLVVAGLVLRRSRGGGWRAFAVAAAVVNVAAFGLGSRRALTAGVAAGLLLAAALWAGTAGRDGKGGRLPTRAAVAAGATAIFLAVAWQSGLLPPLADSWLAGQLPEPGDALGLIRRRLLTWEAGLEGFLARPLTGWGVENFHLVFDRFIDPEYYRTGRPYNWDRAHNVFVGALAGAGTVGAVAYGAFWVGGGTLLWRAWRQRRPSRWTAALLTVGVTAYFVYLLFWFEDHNTTFVLLALLAWLRFEETGTAAVRLGEVRPATAPRRRWLRRGVLIGGVAVGSALAWRAVNTARTARHLVQAASATSPASAVDHYETARRLGAPQGRDVAVRYASFVKKWGQAASRSLRQGERRELFLRAVGGAEAAVNRSLVRAPRDVRLLLSQSDLAIGAFAGTGAEEADDLAVKSIRRALEIAPDRLHYYLVLASYHAAVDRSAEALETVGRGIGRYPAFADAYRVRSRIRRETGRRDSAVRDLRRSLWLEGDRRREEIGADEPRQLAQAEYEAGRPGRAAAILADWAGARYSQELWRELDRPGRRAFLREVGLRERVSPTPGGEYAIASGDLYLFVRWHRYARAAGDTAGARLAVETALDGLSDSWRTERLRPTLRTLLDGPGGETP